MQQDKSEEEQKATAKEILKNIIVLGKAELDVWRQKLGIPADKHTIGVAKTDIPDLQHKTFEGASPRVRKEAGLPDATPKANKHSMGINSICSSSYPQRKSIKKTSEHQ